ncbi:MAG: peptidase dimerization domain-containing protein, partial [Dehalococcoidia bacterium]
AAGTKINVIPARSEATLDCRLLPEQDPEDWRQQVIARIDDPRITVEFVRDFHSDTVECPWDTELFAVIQQVVTEAMEDAVVLPTRTVEDAKGTAAPERVEPLPRLVILPTMTVGGTDNKFLRERGIPAYGFIPVLLSAEEAAGFHGNNEKISIVNFEMGCYLMYEIVRRFCAA